MSATTETPEEKIARLEAAIRDWYYVMKGYSLMMSALAGASDLVGMEQAAKVGRYARIFDPDSPPPPPADDPPPPPPGGGGGGTQ